MIARRRITTAAVVTAAPAVAALLSQRSGGARERRPGEVDEVEEAGFESFPASDPPSWTLGRD